MTGPIGILCGERGGSDSRRLAVTKTGSYCMNQRLRVCQKGFLYDYTTADGTRPVVTNKQGLFQSD